MQFTPQLHRLFNLLMSRVSVPLTSWVFFCLHGVSSCVHPIILSPGYGETGEDALSNGILYTESSGKVKGKCQLSKGTQSAVLLC